MCRTMSSDASAFVHRRAGHMRLLEVSKTVWIFMPKAVWDGLADCVHQALVVSKCVAWLETHNFDSRLVVHS
jgi:hypothetical protein